MKLRIYESLYLLNQTVQETVQILKRLEKCPGLRRDFLRFFQVEVEETPRRDELRGNRTSERTRARRSQRRVHSGYTRKKARVIPFKSAEGMVPAGGIEPTA
jgi:hypothetical protein